MIRDFFSSLKEDKYKRHIVLAFFLFAVFIFVSTQFYLASVNVSSRFATMKALVEHQTFAIDDYHSVTNDKIFRQEHYYSSKPPVLSLAGAGIYYVLHNFFAFDLQMKFSEVDMSVYIITIILSGLSYLWILFLFYKIFQLLNIKKKYQSWLLLGFGLGTLYLPYATTLNNHTIAGAFLLASFYYLLKLKLKVLKNYKKGLFLMGLFASIAAVLDLPTGLLFLVLFFIYIFFNFPKRQLYFYILGAIPFLALHLFLNYQIVGTFLPPQFLPEYWDGNNNVINFLGGKKQIITKVAFNTRKNPLFYIINILIGTHGLFSYSPILIFSCYGFWKVFKNKSSFRKEAIIVLFAFLSLLAFYTFKISIYTGTAFGFRWLIAITPLLYIFLINIFSQPIKISFKISFLIVLFFSTIISIVGLINPWSNFVLLELSDSSAKTLEFPFLANLIMLLK
jgi:hypothetical protein